ncbi:MAG: chromosome segregation protein SMC [Chloroflexota bacterium]|nr:chromosome segregation protein SMC [Chloroflexota bacterium]
MSRLKELRLHGFKTFADPTRFVFERGVNAVIGPNGSGKSNMADAIRWVLGEQSNRSLRTRRADEVIFAGSDARKPQGMAEAILTLDNTDGWLPVDFAEVSIGRRAYRSGETEYLVNGARARLKDVVELLAGGRLGANELVVVGQGTVDAALSLRPEERRQLFEEAAGVKNLQVRRNEATGRLARARDNLSRVSDVIGELRPQVRKLAVQAQHQQEHDALGQRARALITEEARRRETAARDALGSSRRAAAAAAAALDEFRAGQNAGRERLAAAERAYWEAESVARAAGEHHGLTREALIRAEGRAETLVARSTEMAESIARREAELSDLERRLRASEQPDASEVDIAIAAAQRAEIDWQESVEALASADAALLAAEDALARTRLLHATRIAGEARRGELLARAQTLRTRIERELATTTTAVAGLQETSATAVAALAAAEQTAAGARGRAERAVAEHDAAAPRADAARVAASSLAERVGALRSELEALHERAERGSRLGTLLTAAGWRTLLDAIDAPEETWPAIEAVVGGELEQALVWQEGDLVERLAEARGTVRLVAAAARGDVTQYAAERTAALAAVRGERTLAEWIAAESAPLVFQHAVVAPDVGALLRGWRALPPGWCAVTAHGDLADGRGLVAVRGRGDAPSAEGARQHVRRREVADALAQLEMAHADARTAAAVTLTALNEAGRQRVVAVAERDEADRRLVQARSETEAAEANLARARRDAGELAIELEQARGTELAARDAPGRVESDDEIAPLTLIAEKARAARDAAAANRDQHRDAWRTARTAAEEAERRSGGYRGELANLEARRAQLAAAVPGDEAALRSLDLERAAAERAMATARGAAEAAAADRAAADTERDRLRAELLEMERTRGSAGDRVADLERAAQAAAIEASRHEDALAALARERDMALESLDLAGTPARGVEPEQPLAADVAALATPDLESELRRVRRTLAQIGLVNPFAVEEHREMAERLDGLAAQDTDLTAAIAATEELIMRLDAEITAMFHAAFTAIGAKFDEFCQTLFGGGSASLQLSESEDGDAPGGIEITVRPPGKRTQRLSMLSGGERALTGVALLFAMLSVNPVPFCILDEVDAALDEANIGRFAGALRLLSEQIDFVVITHNRATIEVADTIYGVTMTDAAVSKVLSLRLADLPVEVAVG